MPYSQKIYYYYLNKNNVEVEETRELDFSDIETLKHTNEYECQDNWCITVFKPYLRPMSSMTEEERNHLEELDDDWVYNGIGFSEMFDFLVSHHLDYRHLIEKGLALEAPADMYKIK